MIADRVDDAAHNLILVFLFQLNPTMNELKKEKAEKIAIKLKKAQNFVYLFFKNLRL